MKKGAISLIILFIISASCFLCVGYASLSDSLLLNGEIHVDPPVYDTIVITDITTLNGATVNSETHARLIPTSVRSTFNGKAGQTVTYRITAHNYSETDTYIFNGIKYIDAYAGIMGKMTTTVSLQANGSNPLPLTPSTSYVNGTPVAPGEDFVFYVTHTLTQDISAEEALVNYSFDAVIYSVTYLADNELYAVDYVINNQQIYYVKTDGPVHPESSNRPFKAWVNANATPVYSYPAGNTNSYTLSATWEDLYLIMFVDKTGSVLYQEVFTESSTALSASGQQTVNAILAELNTAAAAEEMSVAWSDYNIANATADIVVRPLYTYIGMLQFVPVDRDGDGIIDYYKVVAVSQLKDPVRVPGVHQGLPVEVVEKLYKNEDNFDYGAGIKTIRIEEGVLRLERNSLAYTADLKTVYLPNSLEYLGKNVFSRNWSNDKKVITIHYNGTMAEWKALVANSHEDWANGITTKDGSRVMCSDGYFEFDYGFLGIGSKWVEHKY